MVSPSPGVPPVVLRGPRVYTDAPLKPIVLSEFLWRDIPGTAPVDEFFSQPFSSLFLSPETAGVQQRNRSAREFTKQDLYTLTRPSAGGLAVAARKPDDTASPWACPWAKVPKKSGEGSRLTQQLRPLNRVLVKPPRAQIPHLHALVCSVLSGAAVVLADAKNFFYLFRLPLLWRSFFCTVMRVASRRVFLELCVLPMGFAFSVWVAQLVARAFVHWAAPAALHADAWVDNFFWVAPSAAVAADIAESVSDAAARVGLPFSDPPTVHTRAFELVGLRFCLAERTCVLGGALRDSIARARPPTDRPVSLRTLLRYVGAVLWGNWALRASPLCAAPLFLGFLSAHMRRASAEPSFFDVVASIPPPVLLELLCLERRVLEAVFRPDSPDPDTHEVLFSDASSLGLGFVLVDSAGLPASQGFFPLADSALPIFARETLALFFGLAACPARGRQVFAAVDNTNLFFSILKGHSRNAVVNVLLSCVFRLLALKRLRLRVAIVPSAAELADFTSRLRALPADISPYLRGLVFRPVDKTALPTDSLVDDMLFSVLSALRARDGGALERCLC